MVPMLTPPNTYVYQAVKINYLKSTSRTCTYMYTCTRAGVHVYSYKQTYLYMCTRVHVRVPHTFIKLARAHVQALALVQPANSRATPTRYSYTNTNRKTTKNCETTLRRRFTLPALQRNRWPAECALSRPPCRPPGQGPSPAPTFAPSMAPILAPSTAPTIVPTNAVQVRARGMC